MSRLKSVDFVIVNGEAANDGVIMHLEAGAPTSVAEPGRQLTFASLSGSPVHGVCGIGNSARFFRQLESKGLSVIPHAFPDHYPFQLKDLDFDDDHPVLMTEKDAVKCVRFASDRMWYVPVNAVLPGSFRTAFLEALSRIESQR